MTGKLAYDLRKHGESPYTVAVVHGGPGARGEMAPVARTLAARRGTLEPLQSATTLEGQVWELAATLMENGDPPLVLIGFSWGAWLSTLVASRYPALVAKLILVGSGPFVDSYVPNTQEARLCRLDDAQRAEYGSILQLLGDPAAQGKDTAFARLGVLTSRTDTYDPIEEEIELPSPQGGKANAYHRVLAQAQEMRSSGALLAEASLVTCPVVAIHGDYDPHPVAGVEEPLSSVLGRFRLVVLDNCGHKPWIERQARESFFHLLQEELGQDCSQARS